MFQCGEKSISWIIQNIQYIWMVKYNLKDIHDINILIATTKFHINRNHQQYSGGKIRYPID